MLPSIFHKVAVHRSVPEPLLPTIAIFAAPASLCLAGYLRSLDSKDLLLVSVLFGLSLASYLAVLLFLPKMLKLKFYPGCLAFTFPRVISAIATISTYMFLLIEDIALPPTTVPRLGPNCFGPPIDCLRPDQVNRQFPAEAGTESGVTGC